MTTAFPWPASSPEIERAVSLIREKAGADCDPWREALAALINTAFWLSLEPFEGRFLRPAFRWPDGAGGATEHARTLLSEPVPIEDYAGVKRLASGWGSPRKILVGADAAARCALVGLAAGPGLWAAPAPSCIVEVVGAGAVVISSYTLPLLAFMRRGLVPLGFRIGDLLKTVLGTADAELPIAIELLVSLLRERSSGGTFVFADPASELPGGGVRLAASWPMVSHASSTFRGSTRAAIEDARHAPSVNPELPSRQVRRSAAIGHFGAVWRDSISDVGLLGEADGAVVFDRALNVHAFGVHLPRQKGTAFTESSVLTETFEVRSTSDVAGTRHASAIEFVAERPDAVAVVVSHDGPTTLVFKEQGGTRVLRDIEFLLPSMDV